MVWKDEAFALWINQWQNIYEPATSPFNLLQEIHDTYYLVNIVDVCFISYASFPPLYAYWWLTERSPDVIIERLYWW
jgi:hypothetical protein